MMSPSKSILLAAFILTVAALALWIATGRHAYTKFVVVERVEIDVDPDDPFLETGFYDDAAPTETVARDEFHFGLLPVPERLIDKHILSVASISGVVWFIAVPVAWLTRRRGSCACSDSCSVSPNQGTPIANDRDWGSRKEIES